MFLRTLLDLFNFLEDQIAQVSALPMDTLLLAAAVTLILTGCWLIVV